MSETRSDAYGYNARNELTNAVKNATLGEYAYQYDDIGNRLSSFDRMGRRVSYLETVSGGSQSLATVTNGNYNFVYEITAAQAGRAQLALQAERTERSDEAPREPRYLCIQRIHGATKNVKLIFTWDPLEKVATKPLMIEKPGSYKMHVTHDGNKNVSELVFFSGGSGIAAHYEYAPFGAETVSTRSTSVADYDFRTYNPFRFSSEYADDALGLVYYNYRHYNPLDGRWMSRDVLEDMPVSASFGYMYIGNQMWNCVDVLGLLSYKQPNTQVGPRCSPRFRYNKRNPGNRRPKPPLRRPNSDPIVPEPDGASDFFGSLGKIFQEIMEYLIKPEMPSDPYDFSHEEKYFAVIHGEQLCKEQEREAKIKAGNYALPKDTRKTTGSDGKTSMSSQKCKCCEIMVVAKNWCFCDSGGTIYALGWARFYDNIPCEEVRKMPKIYAACPDASFSFIYKSDF